MAQRKRQTTSEKVLTVDQIKISIEEAFEKYAALGEGKKNINNSGAIKFNFSIQVTADSAANVQLPLKLLLAGGYDKGNAELIAKCSAINKEVFKPVGVVLDTAKAAATINRLDILEQNAKIIGTPYIVVLKKAYDKKRKTKTLKVKNLLLRLPSYCNMNGLALALGKMNQVEKKAGYLGIKGPSQSIVWKIPSDEAILASLEKDFVKTQETEPTKVKPK